MRRNAGQLVAVVITSLLGLSVGIASAQTSTTSTDTKKFTVIAVDGNQLVVRLPEGTREITVPEDFRFNVNGQSMSVHDLKPGMSGTAVITTTTTVKPVTVTEVRNGTVEQVSGGTIIVRGPNGFRMFTQGEAEKRGVKIIRNGQPVEFTDLRRGDHLTATIVTEKPPQVMTKRQVDASIAAGAPAATAGSTSAGSTSGGSTSAGSTAASSPPGGARAAESHAAGSTSTGRKLPKTASLVPVLGLVGLASLAIGVALTSRRRRISS